MYADKDANGTVEYAEFMQFSYEFILHALREKAL